MRVILLTDVPKVGRRWEVKEVSVGFARNYLFPRNLAQAATPNAILELEQKKEKDTVQAEKDLLETEQLAARLDGLEVEITAKLSDKGVSYGALSAKTITESLNSLGFKISEKDIVLGEPIKKIGEYPVTIALKHGLEAEIRVLVSEESDSHAE